MKYNKNRDAILAYLQKNPNTTIRSMQEELNLTSPSIVTHHIKMLTKMGLLKKKPPMKIVNLIKRKEKILADLNIYRTELESICTTIKEWEILYK